MKNIFIKILINVLILIILLLFLDFIAFYLWRASFDKSYKTNLLKYISSSVEMYRDIGHSPFINKEKLGDVLINSENYRPVENPDAEPVIVIFGCSFAYGAWLGDDETFSHLLAKETGYKVINRAVGAGSVQHMLYQLENENFYKIIPKADYVIYVYMYDQIKRTYLPNIHWNRTVYYKKTKDNNLNLKKFSINYANNSIIGYFAAWICEKFGIASEKDLDFYFLHITQSIENIKKHWGNDTKVILLYYPYGNDNKDDEKYVYDLEKQGVIVVKTEYFSSNDYVDLKYKISPDDFHPNKLAWEEITPLFVKYMNKQGYLLPNK